MGREAEPKEAREVGKLPISSRRAGLVDALLPFRLDKRAATLAQDIETRLCASLRENSSKAVLSGLRPEVLPHSTLRHAVSSRHEASVL